MRGVESLPHPAAAYSVRSAASLEVAMGCWQGKGRGTDSASAEQVHAPRRKHPRAPGDRPDLVELCRRVVDFRFGQAFWSAQALHTAAAAGKSASPTDSRNGVDGHPPEHVLPAEKIRVLNCSV
jgi:hypothetical protein